MSPQTLGSTFTHTFASNWCVCVCKSFIWMMLRRRKKEQRRHEVNKIIIQSRNNLYRRPSMESMKQTFLQFDEEALLLRIFFLFYCLFNQNRMIQRVNWIKSHSSTKKKCWYNFIKIECEFTKNLVLIFGKKCASNEWCWWCTNEVKAK